VFVPCKYVDSAFSQTPIDIQIGLIQLHLVFYLSVYLGGLRNFDEVFAILVLIWVIRKAYVTATGPGQRGTFSSVSWRPVPQST
jgi:hypothetical protein